MDKDGKPRWADTNKVINGFGIDIHKWIGKVPKPKGG